MSDYVEIKLAALELIQFVVDKYGITSYREFTCPYMRRLAKSLDFFDR